MKIVFRKSALGRVSCIVRVFVCTAMVAFVACAAPRAVSREIREPKPLIIAVQTPVFVDSRFAPYQKAEIENALMRWNWALGGARVFLLATDEVERPRDILAVVSPVVWGVTITFNANSPENAAGLLATCRAESDVQFYADHFRRETYESVALHELGHVLGLDDDEPDARLMAPHWAPNQNCIDAGTVARVAHRHPTWRPFLQAECE